MSKYIVYSLGEKKNKLQLKPIQVVEFTEGAKLREFDRIRSTKAQFRVRVYEFIFTAKGQV